MNGASAIPVDYTTGAAEMALDHDAPSPLAVERLMLTNFRCYTHAVLEPGAWPVVLSGANGAGKTNILEAVSLLTPGRGMRRARLNEVARQSGADKASAWAVAAQVSSSGGSVELGTGLVEPGADKRTVRIHGETASSQAALSDHMDAQWLTPQMDRLFMDGRSARRRFLDRLVFGYDPAHAGRLNGYEHAMRERARLLRDGTRDALWLNSLEETMVSKGIAVAAARLDLVQRLGRYCHAAHGPFPGADLEIDGRVEAWLRHTPALTAEDNYRASLADSRAMDAITGGAATGPHKSDLHVRHLGKDQPADICSTGEQKALLISIILADARMTTAERGRVPVLLLDEVAAHLDQERREALFRDLTTLGAQAWLTGTDQHLFESLQGHAQFYTVADATVTPVTGTNGQP